MKSGSTNSARGRRRVRWTGRLAMLLATGLLLSAASSLAQPVVLSPATLPAATVGVSYSQTITASGATAPYTFAPTAGSLPASLSLSSAGVLSGPPTAGGTFSFTVTATDSSAGPGPYTGSQAYTLTVQPPTIVVSPATLPGATVGVAYSQAITAGGATAPYSFAVIGGVLPAGLTLSSAGVLSGPPTAGGTFNFTVAATDSSTGTGPFSGSRSYSMTVTDVPPVANPVSITVAYGSSAAPVSLNITGGVPTSVAVASAPAHGTAIASGTGITYQPVAGYAGPDSFTYTATNGGGTSAPATVTVTVQDPVITITASGGLIATAGTPYTQTFTWNGGAPPWSGYQVTNLPAGLSITGTTANGVTVSGTPTQAGGFTLNVSATDSSTGNGPYTVGQAFTLTVNPPTIALSPATLPAGVVGTAYSQTLTASGGVAPYTWGVSAGTLPNGLGLSAGGVLAGTPTQFGTFDFSVTATDSTTGTAGTATRAYSLVIAPVIGVSTAGLGVGFVRVPYTGVLTASGGTGPYTFAVTGGALPDGLSLSPDGTIAGAPTAPGSTTVTITATDSQGFTGSAQVTVTIALSAAVPVLEPGALLLLASLLAGAGVLGLRP